MHCNHSSFLFKSIIDVSSSYDEVNFNNSGTEAIVNKDLINKKSLWTVIWFFLQKNYFGAVLEMRGADKCC